MTSLAARWEQDGATGPGAGAGAGESRVAAHWQCVEDRTSESVWKIRCVCSASLQAIFVINCLTGVFLKDSAAVLTKMAIDLLAVT